MTPNETTDRADATVWLPLLHILGGVAERVARRGANELSADNEKAVGAPVAGAGEGR